MVCTGDYYINGQRFLLCISINPPFEIENFSGGWEEFINRKRHLMYEFKPQF